MMKCQSTNEVSKIYAEVITRIGTLHDKKKKKIDVANSFLFEKWDMSMHLYWILILIQLGLI